MMPSIFCRNPKTRAAAPNFCIFVVRVWILFVGEAESFAFSRTNYYSSTQSRHCFPKPQPSYGNTFARIGFHHTCRIELLQSKSENEDDDGWVDRTRTELFSNDSTFLKGGDYVNDKQQQKGVSSIQSSSNNGETKQNTPNAEERDLFIPIFTLVSLTGLFGAYGYEMIRLYLRGELYLPWN
ncbi:hypothetical protein ACA910_011882 [Epithemia clementina (nom. ined.)]